MKHEILTSNGVPVQLIRYFSNENKNYLIFTKETDADAQGYVTIHISEVTNDNGLSAIVVDDQISKDIIKKITNANKNNLPLDIIDLDYNIIDGINILGDKAYKVLPNYVEILSKNQPIFDENSSNQDNVKQTSDVDFSGLSNENLSDEVNLENNPFNISQSLISNANENVFNNIESSANDNSDGNIVNSSENYEKLYFEQLELVKNLQSEIEIYKNKIEVLKNIINN